MFNFSNNKAETEKTFVNNTEVKDFETLQKARKDLMGEIEAIIEYDEHIHSSSNMTAKNTWQHIKNEELHHVGELLALLNYLDPSQKKFVEKGMQEFLEDIKNVWKAHIFLFYAHNFGIDILSKMC